MNSKQELKNLYHLNKITAKEYFLALGKILQQEAPPSSPVKKNDDILAIFDGNLPIFNQTS